MTITTCPKCGSMNITTAGTCANCGWSQFAQVTVSSGVYKTIGEIEIKVTGKALLDDYEQLLFENNSLTARIAKLEATVEIHTDISNAYEKRISEIVSLSNKANAKLQACIAELEDFINQLIEAGNELEAGLDEYWEELSTREVANWRRLVKDWKEGER